MLKAVKKSLSLLSRRQRGIYVMFVVARALVNFLDLAALALVGLLGSMLASGLTEGTEATFFGYTLAIESSRTYLVVG